jgi:putative oxidoreductase
LVAGILSRFSAAAIIVIMAGAVMTVHLPFGFFMNWAGTQKGEGFEFHILMIGLVLTTLVAGPGSLSLARLLRLPKALE